MLYVLFPIEFLTTARFHDLRCKCELFIPKGRINFESGLGKTGKSPAFGSVVIKLSDRNVIHYVEIKPGNNVKTITPEDITLPNTEDLSTIVKKKKSWYR